jgi:hypothetical protein
MKIVVIGGTGLIARASSSSASSARAPTGREPRRSAPPRRGRSEICIRGWTPVDRV